jgi:predicted amidophosphoribosyltransferase
VIEKPDLGLCVLCGDPSETARNICFDCLEAVEGKHAFKKAATEKQEDENDKGVFMVCLFMFLGWIDTQGRDE